MREGSLMEKNGDEKPVYYRVYVDSDSGKKSILGLPDGENPADYEIELATQEVLKELGEGATKWVAVKKTPEVLLDERDWDDQAGMKFP